MIMYLIKKKWEIIVSFFILFLLLACKTPIAKTIPENNLSKIPPNFEFYITPQKEYYLPYQRISLNLKAKNEKYFEELLNLDKKEIFDIRLTPLSLVNHKPTYKINWENIHRNGHGFRGKTTRLRWDLTNNWSGIIAQKPQKTTIQFVISTPAGYWETDEFEINIHVPLEEKLPYEELLKTGCYKFFEYEYSVRMYRKNYSTFSECPKEKLPYADLGIHRTHKNSKTIMGQ